MAPKHKQSKTKVGADSISSPDLGRMHLASLRSRDLGMEKNQDLGMDLWHLWIENDRNKFHTEKRKGIK